MAERIEQRTAVPAPEAQWQRRVLGGCVHAFTASGILCALAAILAIHRGAYEEMFLWLGLAFIIDGIDGTFARMVDVKEVLPRFSGDQLDLVVDYVTYVFVPVLALLHAKYLPGWHGLVLAGLILMSSLFHFSDTASKADDHCFVGFPAIWNIVAFYIFALSPPAWAAAGGIVLLVGLTFVPMRWVHPMRLQRLRWVNLSVVAVWTVTAGIVVLNGLPAGWWGTAILTLVAAYGVGLTFTMPWSDASKSG